MGSESEVGSQSLEQVLGECRRWVEAVTGRQFAHRDFRQSLQDGVLLCELVSRIKPGTIRRINGLSTTYAYLDNLKSFLQACEQFGLKGSQLFDITDLQRMSPATKRNNGGEGDKHLRNVALTIYWLGKAASNMPSYAGPELNWDAFSGLIGKKEAGSLFEGIETSRSIPSRTTPTTSKKMRNEEQTALNNAAQTESRSTESQGNGVNALKETDGKFRDLTVRITKIRRQESGFGLTVAGGSNEGIQPNIHNIKPGSSSSLSNVQVGDEILSINGQSVVGVTHQKVLSLLAKGDAIGSLSLKIRRHSSRRGHTSSISLDDVQPQTQGRSSLRSNDIGMQVVPPAEEMWIGQQEGNGWSPNDLVVDHQAVGSKPVKEDNIQQRDRNGYQENEPAVSVDSYVEYSETPGALFPDPPPLPPDVVDIDNEVQQSEQTHPHGYGAESDTSSSLPQLMNEQSMDARVAGETESAARARSVEREKEEVEFLKRRRSEQSARISNYPQSQEALTSQSSLQEQIKAELRRSPLAPRRGITDQSPNKPQEVMSAIGNIVNPKHQEVPLGEVMLRKNVETRLIVEDEEQKRLSQQMQVETDSEFRKTVEGQEKMRQLEKEADELIALAQAELLLAGQELQENAQKMSNSYPHDTRKKGAESVDHSSPHSGSRFSLSVWSDSNMNYEDDDTELQGLDNEEKERILENELKKLHDLELEWAQEHRQERLRKGTGESAEMDAREKERLEEEKKKWEKEKEKERTLERKKRQQLEDEKRKLEEEKTALEEERRLQLIEQERQRKELEIEKQRWEEEKRQQIEKELQSRMKLEEEKMRIESEKQRYSEERERRRRDLEAEKEEEEMRLKQQVEMEKRKRREGDARRLALEEERERLLEEDRQRQIEMQEEMKRLQQVEAERKRRQEQELQLRRQEEDMQRESHTEDVSFTRHGRERQEVPHPNNIDREERVRRVKDDIALAVQRREALQRLEERKERAQKQKEEKPRQRDGGERQRDERARERKDTNERHSRHQHHRKSREARPPSQASANESFMAQTVFNDDSGVFMTEL